MNLAMPAPKPPAWYASVTARSAARARSASGRTVSRGGSWATRVPTSSGCSCTRARALTAPPLLPKMSTGPVPSAVISACRSAECSAGERSSRPSLRVLRPRPRGSHVTTVRSSKNVARVSKPRASMGWPIISSGSRPSRPRRVTAPRRRGRRPASRACGSRSPWSRDVLSSTGPGAPAASCRPARRCRAGRSRSSCQPATGPATPCAGRSNEGGTVVSRATPPRSRCHALPATRPVGPERPGRPGAPGVPDPSLGEPVSRSMVRSGDSQPYTAATSPTETTATSACRSPISPARALAPSAPPVHPTPNDSIRPAVLTRPSSGSGVTCWR